jgi:hypothetical protein
MINRMEFLEELEGGKMAVKVEQARDFLSFLEHETNRHLVKDVRRMLEIQEELAEIKEIRSC